MRIERVILRYTKQQEISMATRKKKSYNPTEALDYLDNLEVSFRDESKVEDEEKLKSAIIFFQPRVNCNGMNKNIDSGDEMKLIGIRVF